MTQLAAEAEALDRALVKIPGHLRPGIRAHILYGHPTGAFLTHALSNDLLGAVSRADPGSLANIVTIAKFFYNDAPTGSWGSAEKVAAWRASGGLAGLIRREADA